MNLSELIAVVSKETNLSKAQVKLALRSATKSMLSVLKSGEKVVLPGFGTFYHRDVIPSAIFGGRVKTRARRKIRFHQSRRLP